MYSNLLEMKPIRKEMPMVNFKGGLEVEDRIRTRLKAIGCDLKHDERLNHDHKIDFVLVQMPENPRILSIGVQLTTRTDDADKMDEFNNVNKNSWVTQRALYLEVGDGVDLESGGALAVLLVLGQFSFDHAYKNVKLGAAHIYSDLTFKFFNLEDRVKELRGEQVQRRMTIPTSTAIPASLITNVVDNMLPRKPLPAKVAADKLNHAMKGEKRKMVGIITKYFAPKKHGFITSQTGETFFFHLSRVPDEELAGQLQRLSWTGGSRGSGVYPDLNIEVEFVDGGVKKDGVNYAEAEDTRLFKM